MSFENKTVLVTGGANGIGYAIVDKFVSSGAKAIIADINYEQGEEAVAKLGNAIFIPVDASKRESIIAMSEQAILRAGKIDILINNAGVSRHMRALDIPEDNWEFCVSLMY